jgi:hypothetical protein
MISQVWQEVSNKETNKTSNSSCHDFAFYNDTTSVARGVKQMKQTKQATHHVMTLPFTMIPRVSVARGVKQMKQTKQATHHVMTLPCMGSSKLNQKLSILDVKFFI